VVDEETESMVMESGLVVLWFWPTISEVVEATGSVIVSVGV
jgi:hypothetical protein